MTDDEEREIERRVLDAISDVVEGTPWAPDEGAVLVNQVTVLGWMFPDGSSGTSFIASGPSWSTRGLVEMVAQQLRVQFAEDLLDDGD